MSNLINSVQCIPVHTDTRDRTDRNMQEIWEVDRINFRNLNLVSDNEYERAKYRKWTNFAPKLHELGRITDIFVSQIISGLSTDAWKKDSNFTKIALPTPHSPVPSPSPGRNIINEAHAFSWKFVKRDKNEMKIQ